MAAEPYLAFFDDSGTPQPDNPKAPFVLGAVVMPFRVLHEVSDAWWKIIQKTCELSYHPPQVEFEPKHVDFVKYLNRLHGNRDMSGRFQAFRSFKLDAKKVSACTDALLSFIAEREDITLLAFAMHKEEYWQRWHSWDFERFANARKLGLKKADEKEIRSSLANAVTSKAFEWGILERLHFLMQEKDGSHAMLIGDASATEDQWHRMQDKKQRAELFNRYTDAKNVVCNVSTSERVLTTDDGGVLTNKVVRRWLEKVRALAGVDMKGSSHRLRHTFCSHLMAQGAPAIAVKELAGHASLNTTMRYSDVAPSTLDAAIGLLDRAWNSSEVGEATEKLSN